MVATPGLLQTECLNLDDLTPPDSGRLLERNLLGSWFKLSIATVPMNSVLDNSQRMIKKDFSLLKEVGKEFVADKCTTMAASIAFYSAFSLAPVLIMAIAVAGFFFGAEAARGELYQQINGFLGNDAAAAIQAIVEHAHRGGDGAMAAITSGILLVVGASATFSSLNTALNAIFPKETKDVSAMSSVALLVRVRLTSFGLVLGIAFLFVVSLVLDTFISFAGEHLLGSSQLVIIADIVQFALSLVILSLAFGALLKFLPDGRVHWRDALVGGCVSATLFTVGKKLFALYLTHAGTASAFGAAGSLAVLLMWLYFSGLVLMLGAEFAAVRSSISQRVEAEAKRQTEPTDFFGKTRALLLHQRLDKIDQARLSRIAGVKPKAGATPETLQEPLAGTWPNPKRPVPAAAAQAKARPPTRKHVAAALMAARVGLDLFDAMRAHRRGLGKSSKSKSTLVDKVVGSLLSEKPKNSAKLKIGLRGSAMPLEGLVSKKSATGRGGAELQPYASAPKISAVQGSVWLRAAGSQTLRATRSAARLAVRQPVRATLFAAGLSVLLSALSRARRRP